MTLAMSGQMLTSLSILGMSSGDLASYIAEKASANPSIQYNPPRAPAANGETFDATAALASDRPSLLAHVTDQIDLAFAPGSVEHRLALGFAEVLEPTGWIGAAVETVAMHTGTSEKLAGDVLDRLQSFEPTGIFARSLAECLKLQARETDALTWELEALIDNLDLLADGRNQELADICDCEVSDLPEIAGQLRGYNPKPGLAYAHDGPPIFPPDLIAKRSKDGWTVELNRAVSHVITISPDRLPSGEMDSEARAFRRRALSEAKQLSQALERRGETLLRTGAVLVARQGTFLDEGRAHLVPLSLEDVAEELELHPSTISRATSGRMIDTPRGAIPLRSFFSRAVPTARGRPAASQDAAVAFVAKAISEEDPSTPLTDDAIAALGKAQGFAFARRTVAKYRGILGIASSYQRKQRAAAICVG